MKTSLQTVDDVATALAAEGYIADAALATALFLSLRLQRPLFLEGESGVGKTEVARTLARMLDKPLIRLQCYEGLDASHALYDWNYPAQLLQIRLYAEAAEHGSNGAPTSASVARRNLYTEEFLLRRPLLLAIDHGGVPPVLLIDEIDRADEEFEAFLLEVLSEFQVSIPELGVIRATAPPLVILTSNRTREVHDALKRRCLYHWIDFPDADKERTILQSRLPHIDKSLAQQVVDFVQRVRAEALYKPPGVAETLDWAAALEVLGARTLDDELIARTLGALLKHRDDMEVVMRSLHGSQLTSRGGR